MVEQLEQVAPIVFEAMRWAAKHAEKGEPPEWLNGNSFAEDRAREAAREIAALQHPVASSEAPTADQQDDWAKRVRFYLNEASFGAEFTDQGRAEMRQLVKQLDADLGRRA